MNADRGLSFGDKPSETDTTTEFATSRAYVIGINAYQNGIPPLRTAVADAERLGQLLEESHGYATRAYPRDAAPSLANLRQLLFEKMPREVGPNDRVLIYFAGHGIALDGEEGPEGFLVPEDANREDRATFLPMTELNDALAQLPCRHLLLILDCCFAGAFRWSSTRDLSALPAVIHRERFERYIQDPAWQVLTSAAYDQKALDVLSGNTIGARIETADHSPFAAALFSALRGEADLIPRGNNGQPGGDGVITATELYLYMRECVETATEEQSTRQTPGLWPLKKHDKGEYILLTPGHELNLPPAPELNYANNPYRGLQSFDEEHSQLFFGRTRVVEELHRLVLANPLTVVLGASGTGKSSVVKAGLLPHLRGSEETDWQILPVIRPGRSPLSTLANLALPGETAEAEVDRLAQLWTDENAFADRIKAWADTQPDAFRLALMVDQFEELVTLCWDSWERERFIELLACALEVMPERFRLVVTLRSDFEPQFSECALNRRWVASRYVVPAMSTDDLREAIEGPASVRVLYFQPAELVDRLINEVIQTPGAIPLLSFTLSELYVRYLERRGDDRSLTQDDYERLGGVAGSLRSRATELYDSLDGPLQATMQRIMLRMVSAQGGELARRRVPRSELIYPGDEENGRVSTVLNHLSEGRLAVEGREVNGDPYVEPAHDALISGWDKLLRWTRTEQEELTLRRLLTPAANDWRNHQGGSWHANPRLRLLVPPRRQRWLARILDVARTSCVTLLRPLPQTRRRFVKHLDSFRGRLDIAPPKWLNALELDFVNRSERRRTRTLDWTVALVLFVACGLSGLTWWALLERGRATSEARAAQMELGNANWQQSVAVRDLEHNDVHAAHLLVAAASAFAAADEPEQAKNLLTAMNHGVVATFLHDGPVRGAMFNDDATRVLSWGNDGATRLWRTAQDAPYKTFQHDESVIGASFNGDASRILTWSFDGTARLWDARKALPLRTFQHDAPVRGAVFNSDETRVLTWGGDRTARLWDPARDEPLRTFQHGKIVYRAAFTSEALRVITVSSDGTVRLWDPEEETPLRIFRNEEPEPVILVNANGTRVLTGLADGTVRLWDPEQSEPLAVFQHENHLLAMPKRVAGATFNGDASRMVTWGINGPAQLWDVTQDHPLRSFTLSGSVQGAVFSADESLLLIWCNDGNAHLLKPTDFAPFRTFQHDDNIYRAEFSGDSSRVLTVSFDGIARLWDSAHDKPLSTFHQSGYTPLRSFHQSGYISGALFSNHGSQVLSWSQDGSVRVWDVASHEPRKVFRHQGRVAGARLNGDESRLLTWSSDGAARLWDCDQDTPPRTFRHQSFKPYALLGASFNDDETQVLTWGLDGTARLWDAKQDEPLKVFRLNRPVLGALFTRDESRVLTWSGDGTARLWDRVRDEPLVTFQHEGNDQSGNPLPVRGALFNRDESQALTWGFDGTARLWDLVREEPLMTFRHEGKDRSGNPYPLLGAQFNRDETRVLTWGSDGTARLWDLLHDVPIRTFPTRKGPDDSGNPYAVSGAFFNRDESRVLTYSGDGAVRLWDPDQNEPVHTFQHDSAVLGASFNGDESRVLTWGMDPIAYLWDAKQGTVLKTFPHVHGLLGALFNGDESRVLTYSSDGTARLWDLFRDEPLRTFRHEGKDGSGNLYVVRGALFNGDETRVVTWGDDGTARLWGVPTYQDVTIDSVKLQLEVCTAATITEGGVYRVLKFGDWLEKREQLARNSTTQKKHPSH